MNLSNYLPPITVRGLTHGVLAPCIDFYVDFLGQAGYAPRTAIGHLEGVAHLARWMTLSGLALQQLDETAITRFLNEHLPRCDCPKPVVRSQPRLQATCAHFLRFLRDRGLVSTPVAALAPIDEELLGFDHHLREARGLSAGTRRNYLRIARRWLQAQFGPNEIVFASVTPAEVRRFIADQWALGQTPSNTGLVAGALRAYFRYRTACGDDLRSLTSVIASPAHWNLASLPKALTAEEVESLLGAFTPEQPSYRRSYAMVRCALDLGLRTCEIAQLRLSDLDWEAGTVTLRRTKSRRQDVLPLPPLTGQALAEYLRDERPPTPHPAVFVRCLAPHDLPLSAHAVRKVISRACRRVGLPEVRPHALRHTLAQRLLEHGGSLKEVADVLRHRSLNTSLVYAKLDHRNLSAVALPWPGSAP